MAFKWSSLTGNPLVTFFTGEQAFSYCDDGKLSAWSADRQSVTSKPHGRIAKLDRVVFHDNDRVRGAFLIGFNVLGGDAAFFDYQRPHSELYASIRCFLQSDGPEMADLRLGEIVTFKAIFDTERVINFWLSHSTLIDETGVSSTDLLDPPGSGHRLTLKNALAGLAAGSILPLPLGRRVGPNSTEYLDIHTEYSRILRWLLNDNPGAPITLGFPDIFSRNFQHSGKSSLTVGCRESDKAPGQYVIEFEAFYEEASAGDLKCFAIRPSSAGPRLEPGHFDLANGGTWRFRQRSAVGSSIVGSRTEVAAQMPAEWLLELGCLSQQGVAQRLDLWVRSGTRGIRDFAGATGASFLPALESPAKGGAVFEACYQVADRFLDPKIDAPVLEQGALQNNPATGGAPFQAQDNETTVKPLSVQVLEDGASVRFQFPLCETTLGQKLAAAAQLSPLALSGREQTPGFIFFSKFPFYAPDSLLNVRMGSLELGFGKRPSVPGAPQTSSFQIYDQGAGPQLTASAFFPVTSLLPGGQDDLPEDSFFAPNTVVAAMPACRTGVAPSDQDDTDQAVENDFYRPRPLLINRSPNSATLPLLLSVTENSGPAVNRTVRLSLDVDGNPSSTNVTTRQQVVVLDSDPFLMAQISFPNLMAQAGSRHIAAWDNSASDGAKWQIPLSTTGFSLALPAQALGEEMVKDRNFTLPPNPFDFRIGPPAVVAIESGPQMTNYAEVPWNLRRILGYAGQTSPGVQVDRLDYELLYGLSCDVSQPFVRLAEVFALLGAIPGRLPQTLTSPDSTFQKPSVAGSYNQWREYWGTLHQRYQARLAVLEPWDSHVSNSLTLKHGMSCVIRYNTAPAQPSCSVTLSKALPQFGPDPSTANKPFQLPYADLDDPITPSRAANAPLHGGVTWAFESRNVFCATLRNTYSTADSAAVSDLDLTALGGYGHQQASFDEGRTSIFADVSLGRTYYYKLERIGRIAVFWNKAKHVIVYERSVVPSRQFYLEQNPDGNATAGYGIPMLRKVEEYVEILEEERSFPDDHLFTAASPPPANATPAQRCGCVAACVFQKGARFPVSSSWGSDVVSGTKPIGWKVPLWKRGALPADIYPFPKVTLSTYADFGGTSKPSPCDIANPENVYFYTDTQEGTGSDTDKWGAVIGIDTVDVPPTKPAMTASASSVVPTVGDVPVPAGFSICTFQLLPPLKAANIVANRVGTPMAVVLDSITMMRGSTAAGPPVEQFTTLTKTLASSWEQQLSSLGPKDWTIAKVQTLVTNTTNAIQTDLNQAVTGIKTGWSNKWQAAVAAYNGVKQANGTFTGAIGRLRNQLLTGTTDGSTIAGGINMVRNDVAAAIALVNSANPASVPTLLSQLVEEQFGAIQKAVLDASAAPGILTSWVQQYLVAAQGVVDQANQGIADIVAAITAVPTTVTPDQARDAVTQIYQQILNLQSTIQSTWTAAQTSKPLPELGDIADGLAKGPLQSFTAQYNTAIKNLATSVLGTTDVTDYAGKLKALRTAVFTGFDTTVTNELNQLGTMLRAGYTNADSTLTSYLDCFRYDLTQAEVAAGAAVTWANTNYQNLRNAIAGGATKVQNEFNNTLNSFNAKLDDLCTTLGNEAANLGNSISTAVNGIEAKAADTLSDATAVGKALNQALSNLPATVGIPDANGNIDPQAVADLQKAVLQFRDNQLAQAHQYVDKYLGVMRGTLGDITANTNQFLSLVRAFGDAPVANTLSFLPGKIGYYYQLAQNAAQVDLSPVTSILRQAGNIAQDASGILDNALNVMHVQLPTQSLADRLVPPDFTKFPIKLSDLFPKFAGIDLSGLFKDIDLNEDGGKIHISHGSDPQTLSAWVQANIGAHVQDVPVFDTGGVSLKLATADFTGQVRIDVNPQGTRQAASGTVVGDWTLLVLGQTAVTLSGTQLIFDSSGKIQFIVQPKNVQLPGVLNFVTQYLAPFMGDDNGLSVQVHGTQVNALLNLPIPDVSGLTSGISNLRLACMFGIGLNPQSQFQLDVGFGLSDPLRPFNVAFFILGGAGYLQATTSFVPASGKPPSCKVDFGIMASASLAIAFGPISGGVYAFMGITAGFETGGPGLNLTAVLIMRGQVNLAGIISASVCMELSVSEQNGSLTGAGYFSISISICWCFTLNISVNISYSIGSPGGKQTSALDRRHANRILLASLEPMGFDPADVPEPSAADDIGAFVHDYVTMTEGY